MRARFALAAALAVLTRPGGAQATVTGSLFDSLRTHRRMTEATVVLVDLGRYAVTDRNGAFRFEGVPAGTHALSFFHPFLDSLDITAPRTPITVPDTGTLRVPLVVPPPYALYLELCRRAAADSVGVIVGRVRSSVDSGGVAGATVTTKWSEVEVARRRFQQKELLASAKSGAGGVFVLCGVPTDIPVDVTAELDGRTAGPATAMVGGDIIARLDLMIGEGAGTEGRVVGTVRDERGRPAANVLVSVAGTDRFTRTDSAGRYALGGIPVGTRSIEARRIGSEPAAARVDVRPNADVELTIALGRSVQVLPSATIIRSAPADDIGFLKRRKSGAGEFMSGDEFRRRGYTHVSEAMLRFNRLSSDYSGSFPAFLMRGQFAASKCVPRYYIDGFPWPSHSNPMEDIDFMMRAKDVRGIEVYLATEAPPSFPPDPRSGCGVILIWRQR